MIETELRDVIPKGWRAYLKESRETFRICASVSKLITTPESKKYVRKTVLFKCIAGVLRVAQPFGLGLLVSALAAHDARATIYALAFIAFLFYAKDLLIYLLAYSREHIFGFHEAELLHQLSKHLFGKSMGQHVEEGSILNIANIDKGRWKVLELQALILFSGMQLVLELFLAFIFLFFVSFLAGVAALLILLMYLVWSLYLNTKTTEICTPIEREYRRINRHRVERWDLIERTKTNGKEEEELATLDNWQRTVLVSDRKFWLWFVGQGGLRGIPNTTALLVILCSSAWNVFQGTWESGALVTTFLWHLRVYENIWQIGHLEHQFNWAIPPVRSLMRAILLPPAIVPIENAQKMERSARIALSFENVSYAYPVLGRRAPDSGQSTFPAIQNICFAVASGEKVALIGASGSGKTTIMRLLLRHMDPSGGVVRINGIPLTDIDLPSWLRLVGYIAQQPQIFDGTIRYNLTYGLSKEEQLTVSDEKLWETMRLLQVDFGDRLTEGLETRVGRHGMKLSGGQAQRLMIAAAVMKTPSFMVIDEATSSLDSVTEREVQHGLSVVLTQDVGALIVAHRLSTVRHLCNRFIVVKSANTLLPHESQIEASGSSFEELYATSETFRALADAQEVAIK